MDLFFSIQGIVWELMWFRAPEFQTTNKTHLTSALLAPCYAFQPSREPLSIQPANKVAWIPFHSGEGPLQKESLR